MAIIDVINAVSRELADEGPVRRWTNGDLLQYYNHALSAMVNLKPELTAQVSSIVCTKVGARQNLSTVYRRLYEIERITNGPRLRYIERGILDDMCPNWMTLPPVDVPEAYCFDETQPNVFYIFPPVKFGFKVDALVSAEPPVYTLDQLNYGFLFDNNYIQPCIDYMLYRAYLRDSEDTVNAAKAALHKQAFEEYMTRRNAVDANINQRRIDKYNANLG